MTRQIYTFPVNISGRIEYSIISDSEQHARNDVERTLQSENFGNLSDVSWTIGENINTKPLPMTGEPEISSLMTLSTTHVRPETFELLTREADENELNLCVYPKGQDFEFGAFIYLTESMTANPVYKSYPEDLKNILDFARARSIAILCLDSDGPATRALPIYDWD